MHFSIPDTQKFRNNDGVSYTAYNIYINGVFHCAARYKQLLYLHQQLVENNSEIKLPPFPPKKLIFTNSQIEERRILLEKYIQLIGQNSVLANSSILNSFLFGAQQDTHHVKIHGADIEISLMNGYKIPLSVSSADSADTLINIVCNYLNLPKDLTKYFSLYLFNWSCAKNHQPCLKKLELFESPYISQKYVRPEDKIVLRKSYWDPCYDHDLMANEISLDLLYLQAIEEVNLNWILTDNETKHTLSLYEKNKQKKEYIELAETLKHYGHIPSGEAVTDLTNIIQSGEHGATCKVSISLGPKELTLTTVSQPFREQRFKVTRMRCWRITTLHNAEAPLLNCSSSTQQDCNTNYELSFEYLISKDNLKWITLRTEHATFISVCLQSIVDELMQQKRENGEKAVVEPANLTANMHQGSFGQPSTSSSSDTLSTTNGDSYNSTSLKETFLVGKLTEKFSSILKSHKNCVENNTFEAIGDEEL